VIIVFYLHFDVQDVDLLLFWPSGLTSSSLCIMTSRWRHGWRHRQSVRAMNLSTVSVSGYQSYLPLYAGSLFTVPLASR